MSMPIESPLIRINDIVFNVNNVSACKFEGGNLQIDFASSGEIIHRITLSGVEAARVWAYLISISHNLEIGD
jgi:hypothetical protein